MSRYSIPMKDKSKPFFSFFGIEDIFFEVLLVREELSSLFKYSVLIILSILVLYCGGFSVYGFSEYGFSESGEPMRKIRIGKSATI